MKSEGEFFCTLNQMWWISERSDQFFLAWKILEATNLISCILLIKLWAFCGKVDRKDKLQKSQFWIEPTKNIPCWKVFWQHLGMSLSCIAHGALILRLHWWPKQNLLQFVLLLLPLLALMTQAELVIICEAFVTN